MGLVDEKVSFRISKPLLDAITELSEKLGVPRSEIIRLAIENYLNHMAQFEDELMEKYSKDSKLREVITEGRKITHEVFFEARYRRMVDRAVKEKLNITQICRITEQYFKEALIIEQISAWHRVNKYVISILERENMGTVYFIEFVERLVKSYKVER